MKLIQIVGARPQFIKYLPVYKALQWKKVKNILIHTGQHYDINMSDIFFKELGIPEPEYHLGVGSGMQGAQTAKMIEKIEEVLIKEKPDATVIYGDTNSTLAGAIASSKLHIPVFHIEAGLRSYNKNMPEEINRVLADHISTILFCPTKTAVKNLKKEGFKNILNKGELLPLDYGEKIKADISEPVIINVGDVMFDIIKMVRPIAEKSDILKRLKIKQKTYAVMTLHRAENVDNIDRLKKLIKFIETVEVEKIIFPVHPRTKKTLKTIALPENIITIEPLGYLDMVKLTAESRLVLTDSGGLQKEAYWLEVPCVTLREETEWLETVELGWNVLYKDYKGIENFSKKEGTPFGDGRAGERIARVIAYEN